MPRWPFVATIETWGWGRPDEHYRLDVDLSSAADLFNHESPTVQRGLSVSEVERSPQRVKALIASVLEAAGVDTVYDPAAVAAQARVAPSWRGDGVVSVTALLPETSITNAQRSMVVELGRAWQIQSFNVWTDETFAFTDATNPSPPLDDPLSPDIAPNIEIE